MPAFISYIRVSLFESRWMDYHINSEKSITTSVRSSKPADAGRPEEEKGSRGKRFQEHVKKLNLDPLSTV